MALCNDHGVYEPDERLDLPRKTKSWRGCAIAEIRLADLGTHWIWATCFQMMTGDCHGSSSPLMDVDTRLMRCRAPSRDAAIAAASDDLRRRLSPRVPGCPDARAALAWLDTLRPAQFDLFGVAA